LEIAMHVLVADDDRDIRDLVAFKLRHAGIEVTAVADGTQALDALRRDCPDVALLDVMMPGLSGIDVVREARKEERFATLPMFLLTAKADSDDVEEGYAAGATDYVTKPFNLRELLALVAAASDR
jgi:DNA-binding response OmpR family regulator